MLPSLLYILSRRTLEPVALRFRSRRSETDPSPRYAGVAPRRPATRLARRVAPRVRARCVPPRPAGSTGTGRGGTQDLKGECRCDPAVSCR
jgi:hypothetical protein